MLNGFSTDPLTLTQWVLVQQQKEVRHLSAAVQYPEHLALSQTCVYHLKLQTDDQRCAGSTCSRQPVNTAECDMCSMQICGLGSAQGTLVLDVNLCMPLPRLVSHTGCLCKVSDNIRRHAAASHQYMSALCRPGCQTCLALPAQATFRQAHSLSVSRIALPWTANALSDPACKSGAALTYIPMAGRGPEEAGHSGQ